MSKQKIALMSYKMSNGGAERVLSELSFVLEKAGYDVHIIVMIDEISYQYAGTLFNVGALRSKQNGIFNKIKRFWTLRNYMKRQNFDMIIDFRFRVNTLQELFIYSLYKGKKIQSVRSGKYENYLFANKQLSRLIFNKFDKIVCVSQKQKEKIAEEYGFTNLTVIQNFVDTSKLNTQANEPTEIQFPYIVAVGRLFSEKQFDKLIETYSQTILPKNNVKLLILGQGIEEEKIKQVIEKQGLNENVKLLGFQNNPHKWVKNALFLVQSSLYEGLPNVLLEALAVGTPIIAFDCFSGPSEIIENKKNGLLVENQNFTELKNAINKMYEDKEFYTICKNNTINSISRFSPETIGNQWIRLIESILQK